MKQKNVLSSGHHHQPQWPGSSSLGGLRKSVSLERNRHERMAQLGLDDFETVEQCSERQVKMAKRLNDAQKPKLGGRDWQACRPDCCACTQCRDGCWFASRRHRFELITEAHRLLSSHSGPLAFVSIAHPKWELPVGKLNQANINAVRQWLYRRFKKLGKNVITVGGFEVSLNVDLDGTRTWAGHVHLVVAGVEKSSLKKALQIEKRYRFRPFSRPVDVRDVKNLGRQLGYSLKRVARRRVAYVDGQGRQNRNQANLTLSEQREFDAWLLGLLAGERTILIGCRLHGDRLLPVRGKRV
jgi:hypothetical protein